MVTTLYLIRHCEAEGNIQEIFQGKTDGDITPKGEQQLDRLSERFRDIPFDVIYSSPLKRALKTAQAAAKYHNVEIITDPAFAEIDGGEMEGHKWNELSVLSLIHIPHGKRISQISEPKPANPCSSYTLA